MFACVSMVSDYQGLCVCFMFPPQPSACVRCISKFKERLSLIDTAKVWAFLEGTMALKSPASDYL